MAVSARRSVRQPRLALALLVVCAAAGVVVVAWLVARALGGSTGPVMLNESDNGRTLTVSQATTIKLQLAGNPTTGYSWDGTIGNPDVLAEASSPAYQPDSTAIGSGGTYTFQYSAKRAGRSDLTLVYHRSWETTPPLKTYRITVIVE